MSDERTATNRGAGFEPAPQYAAATTTRGTGPRTPEEFAAIWRRGLRRTAITVAAAVGIGALAGPGIGATAGAAIGGQYLGRWAFNRGIHALAVRAAARHNGQLPPRKGRMTEHGLAMGLTVAAVGVAAGLATGATPLAILAGSVAGGMAATWIGNRTPDPFEILRSFENPVRRETMGNPDQGNAQERTSQHTHQRAGPNHEHTAQPKARGGSAYQPAAYTFAPRAHASDRDRGQGTQRTTARRQPKPTRTPDSGMGW